LCACILLFCLSAMSSAQSDGRPIRLTDTMTSDEFKKCGLQKLTSSELESLNHWMVNTMAQVVRETDVGNTETARQADTEDELSLFDSHGNAVAYVALPDDSTIYTWVGKPVAYLDGNNV